MGDTNESYTHSPSTRWAYKRVKIDPPPAAPRKQRPKAPSEALQSVWNGRNALTVTVRYRGGAEAWYEIRARGRVWRFPGHVYLHDAMETVYRGRRPSDNP